MNSREYKDLIIKIIKNRMKNKFPGLKKDILEGASREIAKSIHARFYGANVDGVESPLWRDHKNYDYPQATKTAQELLND